MGDLPVALRIGAQRALLSLLCGLGGCVPSHEGEHGSTSTQWRVATEPALSVGAFDSNDTVTFRDISAAVRLGDGRIVVADGGLHSRLTALGPDGRLLTTIGRYGEGPGEYRYVTTLQAGPDDSLYVFDVGQQRLMAFTGDGHVGRTERVQSAGTHMLRSVSRLSNSVWVASEEGRPTLGVIDQIVRDTIAVGLLSPTLGRMKVLTHLPTAMAVTFSVGGQTAFGSALFSPRVLRATWGRCIFLSGDEDSSIEVYAESGEHVASISAPGVRRPVTPEAVSAYIQARLVRAATAQDTAAVEAKGRTSHPEYLPYFNQMVIDEWGDVWLEEYSPPLGSGGRWHVITQLGQDMGVAVTRPRLTIFEITAAGVLGAWAGAFDEPTIVVLPLLSRPSERPSVIPACQDE